MFGRKRKMNNAAAGALPAQDRPPISQTVHNHGANWPGIVIVGFVCLLAILPVFWLILTFLFGQLGSRNPSYDAAWWLIYPPLGLCGLAVLKWFLTDWFAHKERMAEKLAEISYNKMLMAGTSTTADYGRNQRKAAIIKAVMAQVYRDLRDNNLPYKNGASRPWSKRQAEGLTIPGLGKVSQAEAEKVRDWLLEFQMIDTHKTNSQPNLRKYPNYETAANMVDVRYKVTMVRAGAMMDTDGQEFYSDYRRG